MESRFLELYKEYEGLLKEHGKDYRMVEDSMEGKVQERMRITRQMRNYMSHNADAGFLSPSAKQEAMLESMIKEERLCGDIVRKHLWTASRAACAEQDRVDMVMAKMAKLKLTKMPITGEGGILGIVDIFRLAGLICEDTSCTISQESYGKYAKSFACVCPEAAVSELDVYGPDIVICCTKDGTREGKFLGVFKSSGM